MCTVSLTGLHSAWLALDCALGNVSFTLLTPRLSGMRVNSVGSVELDGHRSQHCRLHKRVNRQVDVGESCPRRLSRNASNLSS